MNTQRRENLFCAWTMRNPFNIGTGPSYYEECFSHVNSCWLSVREQGMSPALEHKYEECSSCIYKYQLGAN